MADDASKTITGEEVIALWPEGPPRTLPDTGGEQWFEPPMGVAGAMPMLRNVNEPTLTICRPAPGKANGVGVIVCPGGGWRILAWTHEGTQVADWLTERGYTAFILKYRVSRTPRDPEDFAAQSAETNGRLAAPLTAAQAPKSIGDIITQEKLVEARDIAADDGRRALEIVRHRAAEWGVEPDKVGLIGFSAGAFLVVDVAMDPQQPAPDFLAAIYGGETRGRPVPADAPPLFTTIAHDDRLLFHSVEGLYNDWSMSDHSAELHIWSRGAHGFGMVKQGLPSDRWIDLFGDWLADKGFA
jgi:acetyl esterase/lipase